MFFYGSRVRFWGFVVPSWRNDINNPLRLYYIFSDEWLERRLKFVWGRKREERKAQIRQAIMQERQDIMNNLLKQPKTWYFDQDGDNYHSQVRQSAERPGAKWTLSTRGQDCKDTDKDVYKNNSCGECAKERTTECDECRTSKEDLKKMFPNASDATLETLSNMINKHAKNLGIDSEVKLQHLLSQTGHETGGFKKIQVTESTYWTTASKLAATYSRFTNDSIAALNNDNLYLAKDYLRNSSGVANVAMCCKNGNGDVASGDGYKYRGRGIMQLTWHDNYRDFQKWYNDNNDPDIDIVKNPNLLSTDDNLAVLSGMWYFKTRVLDKIKDFDTKANADNVTIKINGKKKKGLADRKERLKKAKGSVKCQ